MEVFALPQLMLLTTLLCVGSMYLLVANLASPSLKRNILSGSQEVTNV